MKRFDVLAAGLMVLDILAAPVDRGVYEVDTVYPKHMSFCTGGDMLNTAINLSKLNARVAIAGALGDDDPGRILLNQIDRCGLGREGVAILPDVNTPVTLVLCETGGERHFIHKPGSNDWFDGGQLTVDRLRQARILYIGSAMALPKLEGEALRALLVRAKEAGLTTVMDAASSRDGRWLEKVEAALDVTDVFFPSFIEAELITGRKDPEAQARFFIERGVQVAGVKLGADGCLINERGRVRRVPAIDHPNPVDMTGAGDSFMAGYVKGMLLGLDPERSAQLGSAVAHECIGSVGATAHALDMDALMEAVKRHYG